MGRRLFDSLAEEETEVDQARGAGLHPGTAAIYESYLDLRRGDQKAARRALAEIAQDSPGDPVLAALLAASRSELMQ